MPPHMYKIVTLKENAQENCSLWKCIWHKICTKLVTLKANSKKIVPVKCIWHHICTKLLLVKTNAKEIITLKCVWCQICTKSLLWMQMLRKPLCENAFDTKYVQNHYFEGKC